MCRSKNSEIDGTCKRGFVPLSSEKQFFLGYWGILLIGLYTALLSYFLNILNLHLFDSRCSGIFFKHPHCCVMRTFFQAFFLI